MQKYFFFTIFIVLIMVAFAVLNANVVPVNLGFEQINASLALLIFIVFAAGALVSFLFTLPKVFSLRRKVKQKDKALKSLENEKNIIQDQLRLVKEKPLFESDNEIIADNNPQQI